MAAPTVEQCHDEVNHPAISLSVTNLACNTAFEVFDACNANGCLTQAAGATIQINVGGGTWACDRDFCGGSGTSCVVYGNTPSQQTACGGAFQA